jgi:hypothetical protein
MTRTYESVHGMPRQNADIPPGTRVTWAKGHEYYYGKVIAVVPSGVDPQTVIDKHRGEFRTPVGQRRVMDYPRFLVSRTGTQQMHLVRFVTEVH